MGTMKITHTNIYVFDGKYVHVKFENNKLSTMGWVHYPNNAADFEEATNELRTIRKTMWPEYVDVTTTEATIDLNRHFGIVKWFNDAKGFGFITDNETKRDIVVHFTAIQSEGFRSLQEGQRVSFEIADGPKGQTAKDVRKI